ncbi:hypothetical protein F8M41_007722 [Gigaspora margarita]|uniref:Uncharacterized protein n=1 Tax=Gigaspora margarita TaxID=4874 RepID=A0A8H4ER48_GIGMA|nr:hypothetical protein F8M41_007722 [Gigaspora margarita]
MVFQFELLFNVYFFSQKNSKSQENLFSQLEFTSEWDKNFDKIIKQLINKYNNKNFGIEEINTKIFTTVELECQVNLLNIVVLEPGPAPNSNKTIFKSIDMYLEDLDKLA